MDKRNSWPPEGQGRREIGESALQEHLAVPYCQAMWNAHPRDWETSHCIRASALKVTYMVNLKEPLPTTHTAQMKCAPGQSLKWRDYSNGTKSYSITEQVIGCTVNCTITADTVADVQVHLQTQPVVCCQQYWAILLGRIHHSTVILLPCIHKQIQQSLHKTVSILLPP